MPNPEFLRARIVRFAPHALGLLLVIVLAIVYLAWSRAHTDWTSALKSGDFRVAAELMLERADENNPEMHRQLGNLYYLGLGVERDYARAARYYSMAAFAGDLAAQVNLGHLYGNGLGVPQDGQLAYAWFNLARTGGNEIAQEYMSQMLKEHKLTHHLVYQLNAQYATIDNFPKLH